MFCIVLLLSILCSNNIRFLSLLDLSLFLFSRQCFLICNIWFSAIVKSEIPDETNLSMYKRFKGSIRSTGALRYLYVYLCIQLSFSPPPMRCRHSSILSISSASAFWIHNIAVWRKVSTVLISDVPFEWLVAVLNTIFDSENNIQTCELRLDKCYLELYNRCFSFT